MTALITGGSSGMGLEYARQLTDRGYPSLDKEIWEETQKLIQL